MKTKILSLVLVTAVAASGQAYYTNSYNFNFSGSAGYTVSKFYILESRVDPVYSYNYGFRQPDVTISAPFGGTVTDYPGILTAPATETLIIAQTDALPGDAPGQRHILLGMNSSSATYAQNIAWGTLFRNTLEDDLIDALDHYVDPDQTVTVAALTTLVGFAQGDAKYGILDNLAQSQTAWFTPGSNFTLMTWSDGAIVGSGTSVQQQVTPEPASLLALGVASLGLLRRRRINR